MNFKQKNITDNLVNFILLYYNGFVKFEKGYLYVKLTGNCMNCLGQDSTINESLLPMFQEEIPEIKGIINVPI